MGGGGYILLLCLPCVQVQLLLVHCPNTVVLPSWAELRCEPVLESVYTVETPERICF